MRNHYSPFNFLDDLSVCFISWRAIAVFYVVEVNKCPREKVKLVQSFGLKITSHSLNVPFKSPLVCHITVDFSVAPNHRPLCWSFHLNSIPPCLCLTCKGITL